MIAASLPIQRPAEAKLLVAGGDGRLDHWRARRLRATLPRRRPRDRERCRDAAREPDRQHVPSGATSKCAWPAATRSRAGRRGSRPCCSARGDFRTRTEDRPLPPPSRRAIACALGPLRATIVRGCSIIRGWSQLAFDGSPDAIWEGLARHGRPIQYAHLTEPLALWDTWTPIAGPPVAFEPPSAGFVLDWDALAIDAKRGVRFATITHAAGISSTGDPELDALLPFDEPYRIPASTADAIRQARAAQRTDRRHRHHRRARARARRRRRRQVVRAGEGMATQRIDGSSRLTVVDAMLSGTHEPGTSHYELLRAFVDDATLSRIGRALDDTRLPDARVRRFGLPGGVEAGRPRQEGLVTAGHRVGRACLKNGRSPVLDRVCGRRGLPSGVPRSAIRSSFSDDGPLLRGDLVESLRQHTQVPRPAILVARAPSHRPAGWRDGA